MMYDCEVFRGRLCLERAIFYNLYEINKDLLTPLSTLSAGKIIGMRWTLYS